MVYRLLLEYDGTEFSGWQTQAGDRRTVQGCLARALEELCGAPVRVTGAGRTDAGVHAEGQVAAVALPRAFEADMLARALNAKLPPDVAVLAANLVSDDFDPRRWAQGKHYRYRVWNAPTRSPLRDRRWLHWSRPLALEAMREAAAQIVGRHDFASFQAAGSDIVDTRRELNRLQIEGKAGAAIVLDFEGSGFLRYMVRNIVGTLLEVGAGRRSPSSMGELLAAQDRRQAGPTAAARGLALVAVLYPEEALAGGRLPLPGEPSPPDAPRALSHPKESRRNPPSNSKS